LRFQGIQGVLENASKYPPFAEAEYLKNSWYLLPF